MMYAKCRPGMEERSWTSFGEVMKYALLAEESLIKLEISTPMTRNTHLAFHTVGVRAQTRPIINHNVQGIIFAEDISPISEHGILCHTSWWRLD